MSRYPVCACPKGCPMDANLPYEFCSVVCANGDCSHSPSDFRYSDAFYVPYSSQPSYPSHSRSNSGLSRSSHSLPDSPPDSPPSSNFSHSFSSLPDSPPSSRRHNQGHQDLRNSNNNNSSHYYQQDDQDEIPSPEPLPTALTCPTFDDFDVDSDDDMLAVVLCACPHGCDKTPLPPHPFCSRSCGNGTCAHALGSVSSTKCACQGCTQPPRPPHPFCSRSCGTKTCGHQSQKPKTNAGTPPQHSSSSSYPVQLPQQQPGFMSSAASYLGLGSTFVGSGGGNAGPRAQQQPPSNKCFCIGCNNPPRPPHPFCSRTCGTGACGHPIPAQPMPSPSGQHVAGPAATFGGPPSFSVKCACHGCTKDANPPFPFCSRSCGNKTCNHHHSSSSLNPPTFSSSFSSASSSPFASPSSGGELKISDRLSVVNPQKFEDLKAQFLKKWLHAKPAPRITEIFAIDHTASIPGFEAYRQMIIAKRPHLAHSIKNGGPGNTRRRFHGTDQQCNLGISTTTACSLPKCRVCQILKSGGLKIKKAKSKSNKLLFGNGLYFTATSSKADDYSNGSTKAVFVAEVILGEPEIMTSGGTYLTKPPHDKDSVLGDPGTLVNYDEVVVYNENACLLKYLVHYRT